MPKTTLITLARQLGVSHTTVSNAFSRPDQLSPDLRDRILEAAKEAGYTGPSPAAASLRTGRTKTLGVLLTDSLTYAFNDPVATAFLSGVASVAEPAGYAMTIVSAPRSGAQGPTAQAIMDGLIVYSVDGESPALDTARSRDLPSVFVDQRPEPGVPGVNIDDRAGARLAVEHLLALGHHRLGLVSVGADSSHVAQERLAGWLAAAGDLEPFVVSCPVNGFPEGVEAGTTLAARADRPTAIACLSDELALGVIAGLRDAGLRVPEDVSVIGFDDSPRAAPFLTTIRQPFRQKGELAARMLLDQLQQGKRPRRRTLPTELIVRHSTTRSTP
ncbi:LacI family DNA-binding transcriptional regulator [Kribbella sp. NPDC056345]|uniref:LacI family DNA-binding transcriptional regulator n=1 Tax=Kribbella sp. NPDC056345 TaxID=3345789 RepID=UPI0035D87580